MGSKQIKLQTDPAASVKFYFIMMLNTRRRETEQWSWPICPLWASPEECKAVVLFIFLRLQLVVSFHQGIISLIFLNKRKVLSYGYASLFLVFAI